MGIFRLALWFRPAGLGLFFAAIGFSYALATSASRSSGAPSSSSRATILGSNCVRPPVAFITAMDLGTVVVGSQFTRQLEVVFGFQPHNFIPGSPGPSSGITLTQEGRLQGAKATADTEFFEVRVQDDGSEAISKIFKLTGVTQGYAPSTPLQFVNDTVLPVALSSEPYSFTFQLNGGQPPYSFDLGDDKDFVNFPGGLELNLDTGEFLGKPLRATGATSAQFSIIGYDSQGSQVKKIFTLKVLTGTISSGFIGTSGGFKLNFGRTGPKNEGRDSLKMTIQLNKTQLAAANIRTVSDLEGVGIKIKAGGNVLPPDISSGTSSAGGTGTTTTTMGMPGVTIFDKNGEIKYPSIINNVTRPMGTTLSYDVKLNPVSGILTLNFANVSLIEGFGAQLAGFSNKPDIAFEVTLQPANTTGTTTTTTTTGDIFSATDLVEFTYRRNNAKAVGTTKPDHLHAPAGFFLISSAKGVEKQIGPNDDVVFLTLSGYLRQAGGTPLNIDNADKVNLFLGTDYCLGQFAASSLTQSGGKLILVNPDPNIGIDTLIIDNNKGTVLITTHGIDPNILFGDNVLEADTPYDLPVTVQFTQKNSPDSIFDGQASVPIYRKGNKLLNK